MEAKKFPILAKPKIPNLRKFIAKLFLEPIGLIFSVRNLQLSDKKKCNFLFRLPRTFLTRPNSRQL